MQPESDSARTIRRLAAASLAVLAGCGAPREIASPIAPVRSARSVETSAALDATLPAHPLSIVEVVKLALARNPGRSSAAARIDSALAALEGAESAMAPRISVDGSYRTSDAPSSYLFEHIDAHSLPSNADFNDPGWFDSVDVGLGARWNLWNGGRDQLAIRAADSDVAARRADLAAFENALALASASAVLDVRTARELGAAARASTTALESEARDTAAKVERGAALRSDQLSLEVRLADSRANAIQAELAERLAFAALRRLLALEPNESLELAEQASASSSGAIAPNRESATIGDALREALERRPELEAARRSLDAARARRESAKRAWLPRLDLEAREYAADTHPGLDFSEPNTALALVLGFDVFDGGARRSAERASDAWVRELESSDLEALRSIEFDVQRAWLARDGASARSDVAHAAVAASEESFELVRKQYEAGGAPVTRFLEAESARTKAKSDEVRARLDLERAEFELARARGIRIDEWLDAGGRR